MLQCAFQRRVIILLHVRHMILSLLAVDVIMVSFVVTGKVAELKYGHERMF